MSTCLLDSLPSRSPPSGGGRSCDTFAPVKTRVGDHETFDARAKASDPRASGIGAPQRGSCPMARHDRGYVGGSCGGIQDAHARKACGTVTTYDFGSARRSLRRTRRHGDLPLTIVRSGALLQTTIRHRGGGGGGVGENESGCPMWSLMMSEAKTCDCTETSEGPRVQRLLSSNAVTASADSSSASDDAGRASSKGLRSREEVAAEIHVTGAWGLQVVRINVAKEGGFRNPRVRGYRTHDSSQVNSTHSAHLRWIRQAASLSPRRGFSTTPPTFRFRCPAASPGKRSRSSSGARYGPAIRPRVVKVPA